MQQIINLTNIAVSGWEFNELAHMSTVPGEVD